MAEQTLRVLVTGGRNFRDRAILFRALDSINAETPITEIIHGNARGADWLADQWASVAKISVRRFPADWKAHGKAAGPIRNRQMIEVAKPNLVVAFLGGPGTTHMVQLAGSHCVPVVMVDADGNQTRIQSEDQQ